MTGTQKEGLRARFENKVSDGNIQDYEGNEILEEIINFIQVEIEEAEKRGRENISIGVLQSIENLYKLWSPEPILPSSPINQFIRELQDLVLKSNLADK